VGERGSPLREPSESYDPQKESYLGHWVPSGSICVQPSDSPGVFSQRYASIREESDVVVVGLWPTPAFLMLHQLAQSWRMSVTPLRPVSMIMCGVKPGIAL